MARLFHLTHSLLPCVMTRLLHGLCLYAVAATAQPRSGDPDRTTVMIEALSRLGPEQVNANPKLKEALDKVLELTRGTPQFVELVRRFDRKDQKPALLFTALQNATNSTGTEAVRLLLDSGGLDLVKASLSSTNPVTATRTIQLLGHTGDRQVVPLIEPFVTDPARDIAVRKQAVRSLSLIQEGAALLLRLAKADKLSDELKFTASAELNSVRWPQLKAEAAVTLPLPQGRNAQPLPPIARLVSLSGDPQRGAEVFRRDLVGCIKCHQVNGEGTDVGPDLSEIGTKLGKDALYESILDPAAGISFGYEAWQITLKNGEEVYGLIVSETETEVAVKAQTGLVSKFRKSEIALREKQKLSMMPAGLQQAMTTEELVDLVEYLTTLRKAVR